MQSNLLITGLGSSGSEHIASVLRARAIGSSRIIGSGTAAFEAVNASLLADEYVVTPGHADPAWPNSITEIVSKFSVGAVHCYIEEEAALFSSDSQLVKQLNLKTSSGALHTYESFSTKSSSYHHLSQLGLPVPKLFRCGEVKEGLNYFVKPNDGFGSIGARVASGEELRNLCRRGQLKNVVVTEILGSPEFTVDASFVDGALLLSVRERQVVVGGKCIRARITASAEAQEIVRHIADSFAVPALFNVQMMTDASTGKLKVTDVNMRPASGLGLSTAAGWRGVEQLAKFLGFEIGGETDTATFPRQGISFRRHSHSFIETRP